MKHSHSTEQAHLNHSTVPSLIMEDVKAILRKLSSNKYLCIHFLKMFLLVKKSLDSPYIREGHNHPASVEMFDAVS